MGKVREGNDVRLDLRAVIYRHQRWWISPPLPRIGPGGRGADARNARFKTSGSFPRLKSRLPRKWGISNQSFVRCRRRYGRCFSARCASLPVKKETTSGSVESFEAREAILA